MRDPSPIVDEVRAVRDVIAKEYDYDIARIAGAVSTGSRERPNVRTPSSEDTLTREKGG
jgi:hypothetical protein